MPPASERRCRRRVMAHMSKAFHGWLSLAAACGMLAASVGCASAPQANRPTPAAATTPSASPTPVAADPSPSARPQHGPPYAILVHQPASTTYGFAEGTRYSIALVAADGSIAAGANPRLPSGVTLT